MLLVGSRALKYVAPGLLKREPKDWDYIGTFDEVQGYIKHLSKDNKVRACYPFDEGKKYVLKLEDSVHEFEIAWPGSTGEELLRLVTNAENTSRGPFWDVPDLNVLFTLKCSHRYKKNSPHFLKNRIDYEWMKSAGAKIPAGPLTDWYNWRVRETYDYKHPNLNQDKKGFFNPNEGVHYVYDHDSIHEAVKHFDKPAYVYFKKDGAQVACDKEKFFALPPPYRIASVLEEAYVLALERSQIPFPGKLTPKQSFDVALMKVCTSITSGWWREWAYDHYFDAQKEYANERINYFDMFKRGLENGTVKPFTKEYQNVQG